LNMSVPIVLGIFIGALIVSRKIKRKNPKNTKVILIFVKFRNGMILNVQCKKTLKTIFCPICSFKNKNPYKMSKHLKGHFKKKENKELFVA